MIGLSTKLILTRMVLFVINLTINIVAAKCLNQFSFIKGIHIWALDFAFSLYTYNSKILIKIFNSNPNKESPIWALSLMCAKTMAIKLCYVIYDMMTSVANYPFSIKSWMNYLRTHKSIYKDEIFKQSSLTPDSGYNYWFKDLIDYLTKYLSSHSWPRRRARTVYKRQRQHIHLVYQ